jgi:pSer/pThr/pTyr-binding forkhead associated (FHA) protein
MSLAYNEDNCLLGYLKYHDGKSNSGVYSLLPANLTVNKKKLDKFSSEKMWLAVRSLKESTGYRLAEGDIIRIGRVKFRVREINTAEKASKAVSLREFVNLHGPTETEDDEIVREGEVGCRICLSCAESEDNPMISPCECDGTMKFIHLRCLQNWLKTRLASKTTDSCISFTWKSLSCELCKHSLPSVLRYKGQSVELIDIPKPDGTFLVLEKLCRDKNSERGVFLLSVNSRKAVRIGRGHESELRVSDISVSRMHASISFNRGAFYLMDSSSKFGTSVQVKRPLYLEPDYPLAVQTGRTLIHLTVKRPWSLIPACFRPSAGSFDIFNATTTPGEVALLPINTGIPLSIVAPNPDPYKQSSNLMSNLQQFGANSSCEDLDEIESPADVECKKSNLNSSFSLVTDNQGPRKRNYSHGV